MMKDDCIFCKLANGIIPTNVAYEDDDFCIFMDAAPAAPGHALVVPKNHVDDALHADEATLAKAMVLAGRTAKAVKEVFGCDGVNIVQNNGVAAGQTVFHLHVHVIPRHEGDTVSFEFAHTSPTPEALAESAAKLREKL